MCRRKLDQCTRMLENAVNTEGNITTQLFMLFSNISLLDEAHTITTCWGQNKVGEMSLE